MDDGALGSHSTCTVDTQANLARFVGNGALYALLHAFQRPFLCRHLSTVVLVTLYLCAGMIGHDPWKQDEAYTFGMALHILQSGDWVVPTLGGEPFVEKPPLFYLVAALMAWLWSPWLPLHDGARLAALAIMAIGVLMTGHAARRLYGDAAMPRAVLLLLACLGLLQHAHEMITDTALFSGFAVAIYGLTWIQSSPQRAGAFFGSGIGIGFMSKGLVEPAVITGRRPMSTARAPESFRNGARLTVPWPRL